MSLSQPYLLITNDDGIHTNGIKALWKAMLPHAQVTVVAPATEQSSIALATTVRSPIRIDKVLWPEHHAQDIWSINGTPADCVKLALHDIVSRKPDFIISGINRGSNLGRTALYSGTVGAAIESVMQGIPAIAISSLDYHVEPDYHSIAHYIPLILQYIQEYPLPPDTLLNINFPESCLGKIKGFKMACQGTDCWVEDPDKRTHPSEGHTYYWLSAKLKLDELTANGDGNWLRQGYATVVPIYVGDLTHHQYLKGTGKHFENRMTGCMQ